MTVAFDVEMESSPFPPCTPFNAFKIMAELQWSDGTIKIPWQTTRVEVLILQRDRQVSSLRNYHVEWNSARLFNIELYILEGDQPYVWFLLEASWHQMPISLIVVQWVLSFYELHPSSHICSENSSTKPSDFWESDIVKSPSGLNYAKKIL